MSSSIFHDKFLAFFLVSLLSSSILRLHLANAGNFYEFFEINWGPVKIDDDGGLLALSLDKASGSGFRSRSEYLFGKFEMRIRLVKGNSAGTVTTFYLSSSGSAQDEIDIEFLGNLSGNPYTLHTNVYTQGRGNREQQFRLWFDPTIDFHTYTILWNPLHIYFLVDGVPIRDFMNMESIGVGFPSRRAMRIYSSLWNADDWATMGGRVKTDWRFAPFIASYRNFSVDACVYNNGVSNCSSRLIGRELDKISYRRMRWARNKYMIYDYCKDFKRFPQGVPAECTAHLST